MADILVRLVKRIKLPEGPLGIRYCNRKRLSVLYKRLSGEKWRLRGESKPDLSPSAMSALFQEIKNRQQAFMKAFNAGDPKGAAAVYDPDGYFMPNGRHPVKGRAGIEEYFKEDMADGVQTAQIITEEVNGGGDWAFERGSYHLDGTRGRESGAYLQVEGEWLIHNDCFNVVKAAGK
ncbi:hypothetical protein ANCCEY_06930 [Ancylostoma ceylanicum]|uniref:DUF4440 domain-containing protein n=1 Tax=Ancylostoma ceylanicum TaxID=53326 RepID=A0A0D6LRZ1_9BILA|nr:hypothetical protein ANCCEY_06930 [Ancylostoma ceylanicum]